MFEDLEERCQESSKTLNADARRQRSKNAELASKLKLKTKEQGIEEEGEFRFARLLV